MKTSLALLLSLNLGLLGWLALRDVLVAQGAEEQQGVLTECTDLNGDGRVDLSDPVLLLTWLFRGGAEPPCGEFRDKVARLSELEDSLTLCRESRKARLPATGQDEVFDETPGQDGQYRSGCGLEGRFTDNGDGTVADSCTGLVWVQNTADTNFDGAIDTGDEVNWYDALGYCEDLVFAGHDDWRLPNVRELQSLVDYGRLDPALDPVFETSPSWYWTSTTKADEPFSAWYVDFSIGYVYRDNSKANRHFVRAVRDNS